MVSYEELFEEYIKAKIGIRSSLKIKELFVLGFVGLTGVGKSSVAAELSRRLGNMPIVCNDYIRRFLEAKGLSGDGDKESPRFYIGKKETDYFCGNKISFIIDADLIRAYREIGERIEKIGYKLLLINIICPEEIVLERIEERKKEIDKNGSSNYSRAGIEEYFERKKYHEESERPENFYFTIDNSKELSGQIDNLLEKMKSDDFI